MSVNTSESGISASGLTPNGAPGESRSGLKIAIVHPTSWPYVRRGTERFMNEFAAYMGGRGHQVKIVCSKPGGRQVLHEQGFVVDYHRSLWHPAMTRLGVLDFHIFPLTTLAALLQEKFDIAHCFNFTDALVAAWIRPFSGAAVVLHLNTIPPAVRYRRSLTLGGAVLRRAIAAADEIITVGDSQQDYFVNRFGRGGVRIPAPVDTETFRLSTGRDHARPVILCASHLDDRRKGGGLLVRAFCQVKEWQPEVVLQISCALSDSLRRDLLELSTPRWRPDIQFLGPGELTDLPQLFARAAVVVVPSLWEAFSMVLLESLAVGTPVVSTSESDPEVIHTLVGRTFDPGPAETAEPSNLEGLTQALLDALELSRRPETAGHCRATAERFSWRAVGPRFEELYRRVLRETTKS